MSHTQNERERERVPVRQIEEKRLIAQAKRNISRQKERWRRRSCLHMQKRRREINRDKHEKEYGLAREIIRC